MNRVVVMAIVFGLVGLIVGYLIFGRVAGEYISLEALFSTPQNIIGSLAQDVTGVSEARRSILISGAVGVGLGIVAGTSGGGRRR